VVVLASALDNLGALLTGVLAVVGGAVAGAVLTAAAVWLVCRFAFKRQPPPSVRKLVRWLGAVAGALAVAAFLNFGLGGGGWGPFGGGAGLGPGNGTHDTRPTTGSARETATTPTQPAKAPDTSTAHGSRIRVVVLGGPLVKDDAYFRIEGQPRPMTLREVQEYVNRQRQRPGEAVAGVDILVYQNSLDYDTEPVRQLRAWAAANGLSPAVVELKGNIPE